MRVLVLALLVLLPAALAHPGDEFEFLSAESGGVVVYLQPQTLVVKAQREVVFVGEAYSTVGGAYEPLANATFSVGAAGPGEAAVDSQPYGSGFTARVNFSTPGAWRILVDANGSLVEVPVDVYPASSVRAESYSLRYDLHYAGRPVKASLSFVDDATGGVVKKDGAATARVERWENGTKVGEDVIPLVQRRPTGDFTFEHTFASEGTYRVRVASPEHGIGYDDLPPFKLDVRPARLADADEPVRETSAAPLLASLAVVVAAAAPLARRR